MDNISKLLKILNDAVDYKNIVDNIEMLAGVVANIINEPEKYKDIKMEDIQNWEYIKETNNND